MEAVVRWASLLDERERAFQLYRKQMVVSGSQGQAVLSPAWKVVQNCDGELRALEDRLGMTPKARLQLGIEFAQAHEGMNRLRRQLEVEDDVVVQDPRAVK